MRYVMRTKDILLVGLEEELQNQQEYLQSLEQQLEQALDDDIPDIEDEIAVTEQNIIDTKKDIEYYRYLSNNQVIKELEADEL